MRHPARTGLPTKNDKGLDELEARELPYTRLAGDLG